MYQQIIRTMVILFITNIPDCQFEIIIFNPIDKTTCYFIHRSNSSALVFIVPRIYLIKLTYFLPDSICSHSFTIKLSVPISTTHLFLGFHRENNVYLYLYKATRGRGKKRAQKIAKSQRRQYNSTNRKAVAIVFLSFGKFGLFCWPSSFKPHARFFDSPTWNENKPS